MYGTTKNIPQPNELKDDRWSSVAKVVWINKTIDRNATRPVTSHHTIDNFKNCSCPKKTNEIIRRHPENRPDKIKIEINILIRGGLKGLSTRKYTSAGISLNINKYVSGRHRTNASRNKIMRLITSFIYTNTSVFGEKIRWF